MIWFKFKNLTSGTRRSAAHTEPVRAKEKKRITGRGGHRLWRTHRRRLSVATATDGKGKGAGRLGKFVGWLVDGLADGGGFG